MNKALFVSTLVALTFAVVAANPTPPCAGGVYGGRRNVKVCQLPPTQICSVAKRNYYFEASCDIWCCPDSKVYQINNCGTFQITSTCCSDTELGVYSLNSPVAPNCALAP